MANNLQVVPAGDDNSSSDEDYFSSGEQQARGGGGGGGGDDGDNGKAGWLFKKGARWNKGWKRRFCRLRDRSLLYFTQPDAERPRGLVLLDAEVQVRAVDSGAKKHAFDIEHPRRTFHMHCETAAEREEWIVALQRVIDGHAANTLPGGGGVSGASSSSSSIKSSAGGAGRPGIGGLKAPGGGEHARAASDVPTAAAGAAGVVAGGVAANGRPGSISAAVPRTVSALASKEQMERKAEMLQLRRRVQQAEQLAELRRTDLDIARMRIGELEADVRERDQKVAESERKNKELADEIAHRREMDSRRATVSGVENSQLRKVTEQVVSARGRVAQLEAELERMHDTLTTTEEELGRVKVERKILVKEVKRLRTAKR